MIARPRLTVLLLVLFAAMPLFAGKKDKDKDKEKPGQQTVVDQGTFAVIVNGERVATESFTIRQVSAGSVTTSELHAEEKGRKIIQTAELKLGTAGNIIRYEWRQSSPEKSSLVLEPKDEMLLEQLTASDGKTSEQSFLLSNATVVLDDYFFSQREILLWRYLGENCKVQDGKCALGKLKYGSVLPRQRISAVANVEYKGREATQVNGKAMLLDHFSLDAEGPVWEMWMDSEHKVQRIFIPENGTEVVRQ